MHSALSYELTQSRISDLHRQARHTALVRAAQASSSAPRPQRRRIPVSLRPRRRPWQATTPAM
jgi:hypothetical protein